MVTYGCKVSVIAVAVVIWGMVCAFCVLVKKC
jgi:hypothetical protein